MKHPDWWLATTSDPRPGGSWLLDRVVFGGSTCAAIAAEVGMPAEWVRSETVCELLRLRAAMSEAADDALLGEACAIMPIETPPPRVLARILRSIEADERATN